MAARVKEWFSRIKNWTLPSLGYFRTPAPVETPEEHLTKALGKYESYVFKIQSILIWDDPLISVLCILAANFIFWFVISFECRFYGLFFSSILAFFVYDMWVDQIWPEISIPVAEEEPQNWIPQHPSGVLSVPEISHYISQTNYLLKDYYLYMKTLRAEQPGVFCCTMCVIFSILAVIGRTVPGAVIGYCILMAALIGPGICIHVLPRSTVDRVVNMASNFRLKGRESDSEVDELLPDVSEANMALFQGALDAEGSDKEDTNEFGLDTDISGLESSTMNRDGSVDTLDDFELPSPPAKLSETFSEKDFEDPGIQFRSSHFNGDSSEEEEMELAQGLAFPDATDTGQAARPRQAPPPDGATLLSGLAQNLTNYVGAMGTSLMSTVISRAAAEHVAATVDRAAADIKRRKNSSDSNDEFEIIDKDDIS